MKSEVDLGAVEAYVRQQTSINLKDLAGYIRRQSLEITPRGTRYGISEEDAKKIARSMMESLADEGVRYTLREPSNRWPVIILMG